MSSKIILLPDQITPQIRALAILEMNRRKEQREALARKFQQIRNNSVLPAFEFLYEEKAPNGKLARFKVAKGGRGKGASWGIADRLIEKASTEPSFILCAREIQKSIRDSVHKLLQERIDARGYTQFFDIRNTYIKSKITKSEFIFHGLNDLTVDSMKSIEGLTDIWLAEAHKFGARSWRVLEPTLRTEGSTIYVDYNPEVDDAPTNKKFTVDCPDNALVKHLTYLDNPYFPAVLEEQRQADLKKIDDAANEEMREQLQLDYNHVWLGHTIKISKASILGAYYTIERFTPKKDEGIWHGPYDGCDWGFGSDPTVRLRAWVWEKTNGRKYLCVEKEAYLKDHNGMALELRHLPEHFDKFQNSRQVEIVADNARPENIRYMKNEGYRIIAVDKWKGSVEDGIDHIKGVYHGIIVHPDCPETAKECKLYSYKLDKLTGLPTTDIIDAWNHCIDALRYAINRLIQRRKGGFSSG